MEVHQLAVEVILVGWAGIPETPPVLSVPPGTRILAYSLMSVGTVDPMDLNHLALVLTTVNLSQDWEMDFLILSHKRCHDCHQERTSNPQPEAIPSHGIRWAGTLLAGTTPSEILKHLASML